MLWEHFLEMSSISSNCEYYNNRKDNTKKCFSLQAAFILNLSLQIIEIFKTEPWGSPNIKKMNTKYKIV